MRKTSLFVLFLFLCGYSLTAQDTVSPTKDTLTSGSGSDKARVFITDSQSWEYVSNAGGGGGAFASHGSGGARPQTAEIVKTFGERCPQVITNNKMEKADYVIVLDHEGGKGMLRHKNKVAVFDRVSGDSIFGKSTLSLGGSVQDACEAINRDWAIRSKEIRAAESPAARVEEPKMVQTAPLQDVGKGSAKLSISSDPGGAEIEIDGSFVGNTPSEVEVAAGEHIVSVSKHGYAPWEKKLKITGGNVNLSASLETAR
jgi:hypothetical protein